MSLRASVLQRAKQSPKGQICLLNGDCFGLSPSQRHFFLIFGYQKSKCDCSGCLLVADDNRNILGIVQDIRRKYPELARLVAEITHKTGQKID
jgi:hypothetical protein